jgi:hypothetical protein
VNTLPYRIGAPRGTTPPESVEISKTRFNKDWHAYYRVAHDCWDVAASHAGFPPTSDPRETYSVIEDDLSGEDAILIASAPDMYAYAEAEEKSRQLWELGEACYRGDGPTIADYFEALERDFPEVAAKCPLLSEEAIPEWFEEAIEPIWARWNMYYLGDGEESIDWLLGEHLVALRTAALAKARGEKS